jgi:hypothetical protein
MADQNEDLFNRYVDRAALQSDSEFAIAEMTRVIEILNKLITVKSGLGGGSTGLPQLGDDAKRGKEGIDQLTAATERLLVSQSGIGKQLAEVRVVQQQVTKANTEAAKETLGVTGAYDRLVKSYNEAAKAAKNLAIEQGQGSIAAQQASHHANELGNQIKAADAAVGNFHGHVGGYAQAFEHVGETIKDFATGYIALIGIQGLGNFLEKTIEEFDQAEVKISSFKNILSNLGREDLFEPLSEQAEELAKKFGTIKSEDVIEVFDKLVTYGKLTENQIKELTPVIVDYAAKTHKSLAEATDVVTKALEGNAKGLREFGINVKDATSATGGAADATDRLSLIMKELKPRVEGAAEAFGETAAGGIQKAKVQVDELEKSIGEKLQPVLSGFLRGFLEGINGIVDGFVRAKLGVSEFFTTVGDFFTNFKNTGSLSGAIGLTAAAKDARFAAGEVIEAQNRIIENSKKLAEGNADKSVEQLEKLLKSYKAISAASVESLHNIQDSGKGSSEAFHKQQQVALADLQNVYQLQKLIEEKKDKSVLGFGGTSKPGGGADDDEAARKHAEEMNKYLIELDDKLAKAKREYRQEELKEIAAQAKEVVDDVQLSLDKRLAAYDIYAQAQAAIINRNAESEIEQQEKILARIAIIKGKDQKNLTDDEEKTRAQEELVTQTIVNLRQKREDAINKLAIDNEKLRKQVEDTSHTETVKKIQAASDKEIEAATIAKDKRIGLLNEEYRRGLVTEDEYQTKRADIEYQAAIKILRINIKLAEDLLAASSGDQIIAAEKKLADLKIALSDLTTKHEIDNNAKVEKSEEDKRKAIIKGLQEVKQIGDQVSDVIGSAIDANNTAKKNALQEQSDEIEKNAQKEIDAVNATTATQQDKAAQIAIINARAQAQKEQIAIKNRQLEQQKAIADKEKAIFDIILGTAISVAEATTIPEKIIAAAIGAAELAIAISTPIPKFKAGRKDGNATLGIVGDGGRQEVMYSPDMREAVITPATDTLAYIPQGWGIAPSVEEFQQRAFQMAGKPLNSMPIASNDNDKMIHAMVREINGLKIAVLGRPVNETILTKEGLEQIYTDGYNTTRYLNGKI